MRRGRKKTKKIMARTLLAQAMGSAMLQAHVEAFRNPGEKIPLPFTPFTIEVRKNEKRQEK
jgi:hypothetical protein